MVLVVFAVTAVLAVGAAAVSATEVSLRCVAVAFGMLAWIAVRHARSRWALAAGCLLFGVVALVRNAAFGDRVQDVGWFGYGPTSAAGLEAMLAVACKALRWEQLAAGVQLGAVGLLAVAVYRLPRVHLRRRTMVTGGAAVVLGVGIVAEHRLTLDVGEVVGAVRVVWPGPVAVVVGLALLVLAGRREDRRWLVAAGAALVAVQAALTQSDLTGAWLSVSVLTDLLRSDTAVGVAISNAVSSEGLEYQPALTAAVTLAGPALIVFGAPRPATSTPADENTDPPPPGKGGQG